MKLFNSMAWCLAASLFGGAVSNVQGEVVAVDERRFGEDSDEPQSGGNVVDLLNDILYRYEELRVLDRPVIFVEFVESGEWEKIEGRAVLQAPQLDPLYPLLYPLETNAGGAESGLQFSSVKS